MTQPQKLNTHVVCNDGGLIDDGLIDDGLQIAESVWTVPHWFWWVGVRCACHKSCSQFWLSVWRVTDGRCVEYRGFRKSPGYFCRFNIMIITRQRCVSGTPYHATVRIKSWFPPLRIGPCCFSKRSPLACTLNVICVRQDTRYCMQTTYWPLLLARLHTLLWQLYYQVLVWYWKYKPYTLLLRQTCSLCCPKQ